MKAQATGQKYVPEPHPIFGKPIATGRQYRQFQKILPVNEQPNYFRQKAESMPWPAESRKDDY
jgi:hypothetical protein